jgi:hypothetical protein
MGKHVTYAWADICVKCNPSAAGCPRPRYPAPREAILVLLWWY